ncbi:hypothetical protein BU16DRAFT_568086 [Lophium mytilinum]|uniref:Uncharacterized protein n=1 Tax=Lophium mytilinum TaxID=390894 RepID=A0A6A6Q7Y3_9PEZI|nr:hypothetical protein BU16DRAFT_568086 [Lophium mytilinum]
MPKDLALRASARPPGKKKAKKVRDEVNKLTQTQLKMVPSASKGKSNLSKTKPVTLVMLSQAKGREGPSAKVSDFASIFTKRFQQGKSKTGMPTPLSNILKARKLTAKSPVPPSKFATNTVTDSPGLHPSTILSTSNTSPELASSGSTNERSRSATSSSVDAYIDTPKYIVPDGAFLGFVNNIVDQHHEKQAEKVEAAEKLAGLEAACAESKIRVEKLQCSEQEATAEEAEKVSGLEATRDALLDKVQDLQHERVDAKLIEDEKISAFQTTRDMLLKQIEDLKTNEAGLEVRVDELNSEIGDWKGYFDTSCRDLQDAEAKAEAKATETAARNVKTNNKHIKDKTALKNQVKELKEGVKEVEKLRVTVIDLEHELRDAQHEAAIGYDLNNKNQIMIMRKAKKEAELRKELTALKTKASQDLRKEQDRNNRLEHHLQLITRQISFDVTDVAVQHNLQAFQSHSDDANQKNGIAQRYKKERDGYFVAMKKSQRNEFILTEKAKDYRLLASRAHCRANEIEKKYTRLMVTYTDAMCEDISALFETSDDLSEDAEDQIRKQTILLDQQTDLINHLCNAVRTGEERIHDLFIDNQLKNNDIVKMEEQSRDKDAYIERIKDTKKALKAYVLKLDMEETSYEKLASARAGELALALNDRDGYKQKRDEIQAAYDGLLNVLAKATIKQGNMLHVQNPKQVIDQLRTKWARFSQLQDAENTFNAQARAVQVEKEKLERRVASLEGNVTEYTKIITILERKRDVICERALADVERYKGMLGKQVEQQDRDFQLVYDQQTERMVQQYQGVGKWTALNMKADFQQECWEGGHVQAEREDFVKERHGYVPMKWVNPTFEVASEEMIVERQRAQTVEEFKAENRRAKAEKVRGYDMLVKAKVQNLADDEGCWNGKFYGPKV